MARSWDARVRGASQKATLTPSPDANDAEAVDADAEPRPSENRDAPKGLSRRRGLRSDTPAPLPGLRAAPEDPSAEADHADDAPSTTADDSSSSRGPGLAEVLGTAPSTDVSTRRALDAEFVAEGLSLAVQAMEIAVAVVERSTGLIWWTSDAWLDRFGEKDLIARHMPTATEFGESPLPSPGQSWQRTRTLLFADGAERLADLLLVGATSPNGTDIVTVVALEKGASGPLVTERGQVISIIDGAVHEVAEGSVAVLYVDIDRFKVVHDLVGNIEALRLLDLVNHRIAATVRGSDLLFRLHSDEFVVVACELEHPGAAEDLAERIRASVATLSDVGHDLALTASVGVALADPDQSGDELLSAAETAVYVAKGRGRNRIAVHDEELRSRTQRLMVVERQLRQAIDRRDVRFAYQPVVEIGTGRVAGAEALLRLGGDIGLSAVEVVAAAEHSGLMGALGVLVLEGVEEQLGELLRLPADDYAIMVNLSATQLADEDLVRTLERLAEDTSISLGRIAVEVPEVVAREHRAAVTRLAELVRPRFQFGIDGFGTSTLKADVLDWFPVDYLKLHRSVTTSLEDANDDERDRIRSLIERARLNGTDVIALGVEHVHQAETLRELGCEKAQGFLYAGAVTADELLRLAESGIGPSEPASTA